MTTGTKTGAARDAARPGEAPGPGAGRRPNRLRRKNLVLMALLVGWVVIIYLVAIVRLGGEG